jgi:ureidoglycolate hydrolase
MAHGHWRHTEIFGQFSDGGRAALFQAAQDQLSAALHMCPEHPHVSITQIFTPVNKYDFYLIYANEGGCWVS